MCSIVVIFRATGKISSFYSLTVSRSLVDEYICPAGDTQPRSARTAGEPSVLYPTAIMF